MDLLGETGLQHSTVLLEVLQQTTVHVLPGEPLSIPEYDYLALLIQGALPVGLVKYVGEVGDEGLFGRVEWVVESSAHDQTGVSLFVLAAEDGFLTVDLFGNEGGSQQEEVVLLHESHVFQPHFRDGVERVVPGHEHPGQCFRTGDLLIGPLSGLGGDIGEQSGRLYSDLLLEDMIGHEMVYGEFEVYLGVADEMLDLGPGGFQVGGVHYYNRVSIQ